MAGITQLLLGLVVAVVVAVRPILHQTLGRVQQAALVSLPKVKMVVVVEVEVQAVVVVAQVRLV
jgi:hypothetical protein